MRIGIDVRDLASGVVGVGTTIMDLLSCCNSSDVQHTYYLYQHSDEVLGSSQSFRKVCVPIAPYQYCKEQVYFSARCVIDALDIFHAPIHVPPRHVPAKTKVVFTVHDMHSELDGQLFPPIMNAYFKNRRKKAIESADAVVVHSAFVKKVVLEQCAVREEKLHLIPLTVPKGFLNGVGDEDTCSRVREHYALPERFVLYVGSIEPWKQVPLLIARFQEYKKKYEDDLHLVLVGRDGWQGGVNEEVRNRVSEDRHVHWLHYVSKDDLPTIYQLATVFASASKWEGFGLIFLEAMAYGKPIIAANRSAIPEVVGDAGILFDPDMGGDFAEKLATVLDDRVIYDAMLANGKKRIAAMGAETYGKQVLDLYERLGVGRGM